MSNAENEGISLILPSYLEADNLEIILPNVISALRSINIPFEVIVVDTQYPLDKTNTVCSKYNVIYLNRENSNSYGSAIKTGIKYAKYSYITIMDSDCSHDFNELSKMYKKMKDGFDVCIASRYIRGGNSYNSLILKLMSYCVNITFRLIFDLNVKDVSNSFRMYNAEKLKSITIECDNFDLVEEILIKFRHKFNNAKIIEIPTYFNKRLYGRTKRNLFLFILSYIKTIYDLLKFKNKD